MALLHISINAERPARVAGFLAKLLGGDAMHFPPFPNSWIAFSELDDGTAIEVYPLTHRLAPGPRQLDCVVGDGDAGLTFVHAAIGSILPREQIFSLASSEKWTARLCDRGPFECIEIWLENRILIEALDPSMQQMYRKGMTQKNWRQMFGMN
jgi:hypothetical protein